MRYMSSTRVRMMFFLLVMLTISVVWLKIINSEGEVTTSTVVADEQKTVGVNSALLAAANHHSSLSLQESTETSKRVIRLSLDGIKVDLIDQSVTEVLQEISKKSGIKINFNGVSKVITVKFEETPLEIGIRKILETYDTLFLYSHKQNQDKPLIKAIWVYSRDQSDFLISLLNGGVQESVQKEDVLKMKLTSTDLNQRSEAIEAALNIKNPRAIEYLKQLLQDSDDIMRHQSLLLAISNEIEIPDEILMEAFDNDSSEFIRSTALDRLSYLKAEIEPAKIEQLAMRAMQDSSPIVQTKALEILDHLKNKDAVLAAEQRVVENVTEEAN